MNFQPKAKQKIVDYLWKRAAFLLLSSFNAMHSFSMFIAIFFVNLNVSRISNDLTFKHWLMRHKNCNIQNKVSLAFSLVVQKIAISMKYFPSWCSFHLKSAKEKILWIRFQLLFCVLLKVLLSVAASMSSYWMFECNLLCSFSKVLSISANRRNEKVEKFSNALALIER